MGAVESQNPTNTCSEFKSGYFWSPKLVLEVWVVTRRFNAIEIKEAGIQCEWRIAAAATAAGASATGATAAAAAAAATADALIQ
ncbi:hypothetical protein STEG23_020801 [Scotinomys teguina]